MKAMGWWVLATACTDTGTADKTSATTGDTSTSPTDSATDTDSPTDPGPVAALNGVVTLDGAPLPGADTRLCRGSQCRYATSDAAGFYSFTGLPPSSYSLEIAPAAGSGLATLFVPLDLLGDTERVIDLRMYAYDDVTPLGAAEQEFPVGTGLTVTLSESAIEPAQAIAEPATEVGGVRVPVEGWLPFDGITGTVLGVWYVDPFDFVSVAPTGLPARFDNEWKLPEATALDVYVGSYELSDWVSAGTATVAKGGLTLEGAALPLIGTVILVQP